MKLKIFSFIVFGVIISLAGCVKEQLFEGKVVPVEQNNGDTKYYLSPLPPKFISIEDAQQQNIEPTAFKIKVNGPTSKYPYDLDETTYMINGAPSVRSVNSIYKQYVVGYAHEDGLIVQTAGLAGDENISKESLHQQRLSQKYTLYIVPMLKNSPSMAFFGPMCRQWFMGTCVA